MLILRYRQLIEVNTDPQRRCYNGCHAKSEGRWTGWSILDYAIKPEKIEPRLKFWRELNDYAVSQRGELGTKCEYEVIEAQPKEAV